MNRHTASVGTLAVALTIVALTPQPVAAQTDDAAARSVSRTPWGDPDLQGMWDFRTATLLERPEELAGKAVLTDEEAANYQASRLEFVDKDRRPADGLSIDLDVARAYNDFWWEYGKNLTDDKRTSLIVDPADGRIPALRPAVQALADARADALARPAHGPEDRDVGGRCILGFNAGPPVSPSAYNNIHIFQTPGQVVILVEMVHDVRVIPLDGRPHLPDQIRQWKGDSRGHWEGQTLVIETTNFTDKASFHGSCVGMHLTERFTRADGGTLVYEYTIDDPESFSAPWSAMIPMR